MQQDMQLMTGEVAHLNGLVKRAAYKKYSDHYWV
jgi:hypothetical protein